MQTATEEDAGFFLSGLDAMRSCAKIKSQSVTRRGTEELLEYETSEHDGEEKNEYKAETEATEAPEVVGDLKAAVLLERGEEEVIRREPEDMGRLEAPAAHVVAEENAPALDEIGMADIEAAFDNHENLFAIDEGYESGGIFTYYATEEEEEMINGELSSSSSGSDDEYVPERKVNIDDAVPVDRPRRRRRM